MAEPNEVMVLELSTICEQCSCPGHVRLDALFGFSIEDLLDLSTQLEVQGLTLEQAKKLLSSLSV